MLISGTGETVKNFKYLQKIGVTHVLNTAENDVTINPQKFRDAGVKIYGVKIHGITIHGVKIQGVKIQGVTTPGSIFLG